MSGTTPFPRLNSSVSTRPSHGPKSDNTFSHMFRTIRLFPVATITSMLPIDPQGRPSSQISRNPARDRWMTIDDGWPPTASPRRATAALPCFVPPDTGTAPACLPANQPIRITRSRLQECLITPDHSFAASRSHPSHPQAPSHISSLAFNGCKVKELRVGGAGVREEHHSIATSSHN